jgi:hypothetical protein
MNLSEDKSATNLQFVAYTSNGSSKCDLSIKPNWFYLLHTFLFRVLHRKGPHGKYCGCSKWGSFVGLGCANLKYQLFINSRLVR